MSGDAIERREVVVVGGGQAGLAIGYFLARQGRNFVILEAAEEPAAAWRERWDSLKLFTPARYRRAAGPALPGRSGQLPRPRRRGGLPDRLRPALRPAGRSWAAASRNPADRGRLPGRARRPRATRPIRSSSPPDRSRCRSCLPIADRPRSRGRPVPQHRVPSSARTFPMGRCWSSVAATPAFRSPKSCPARTRCTCRSDRGRRRCLSGFSAATCSGTSTRPG